MYFHGMVLNLAMDTALCCGTWLDIGTTLNLPFIFTIWMKVAWN
jgi:hypothetical protein